MEPLLEDFLRYVKIWTTSAEDVDETPTTQRQFDLAKILVEDLHALGLNDAAVDEHAYVYGHLPATKGLEKCPALGFIAHLDTAEFCGENVKPRVIENYNGGAITLENGLRLTPEEFPHLPSLAGRTLIVTDGTTLLGADDKAGIAAIIELLRRLRDKDIPHGAICVAFNPDEEVGAGTCYFDLTRFGATAAYTVDGGAENDLNWECFNAAAARVSIAGKSIHPGSAKNKMVNANLVAMEFNALLPEAERPEKTEGYEGFYGLMHMAGTVDAATMDYILRDHDAEKFEQKKCRLQKIAETLNIRYGTGTVTVELRDQYRNMREALTGHEETVQLAVKAMESAQLTPDIQPIRGGTDGAALSYMGLPCPNIGAGGYNFHGPLEHITLEGMQKAAEVMENLVIAWTKEKTPRKASLFRRVFGKQKGGKRSCMTN